MKIPSFLIGVLIAGLSGSCLAQWQWLDKDGRKVFSDRAPPPDVPEKSIVKRPNAPKSAVPGEDAAVATASSPSPAGNALPMSNGLDKELEAKKKQAADAEAAKRKIADDANTKARQENCSRAKQAKATIDSGIRISRTNAAGEPEIMDDAARAAEARRVQGVITSDCK